VKVQVEVFWVVMSVSIMLGCQCFRDSPWRWRQHRSPKRWYPTITLHGVTTERTSIWILWVPSWSSEWIFRCLSGCFPAKILYAFFSPPQPRHMIHRNSLQDVTIFTTRGDLHKSPFRRYVISYKLNLRIAKNPQSSRLCGVLWNELNKIKLCNL
jgi:hypothetical protein